MPGHDKSRIVGKDSAELEEFVCGICHDILNDPIATQCCRQSYCKQCIDIWLKQTMTCPNDRKPMTITDLVQVPRLVLNLIDNMQIRCRYSTKGCDEVVTIGKLAIHEIECLFSHCKVCGSREPGEDHDCLAYLMQENLKLKKRNMDLESEAKTIKEERRKYKCSAHDLGQKVESLTNKLSKAKNEVTSKNQELEGVKKCLTTLEKQMAVFSKVNLVQDPLTKAIIEAKFTQGIIKFDNIDPNLRESFLSFCTKTIFDFNMENYKSGDFTNSITTKVNNLPKIVRMNTNWKVNAHLDTDCYIFPYKYLLKINFGSLVINIYSTLI